MRGESSLFFLLCLLLLPFAPAAPLFDREEEEKGHGVMYFNWHTQHELLIAHNINRTSPSGTLVISRDLVLLVLCQDVRAATLHFEPVINGEIDCKRKSEPIGMCPQTDNKVIDIHMDKHQPGEYIITSYSNSQDDGSDEAEGGFCAQGAIFNVTVVEKLEQWKPTHNETMIDHLNEIIKDMTTDLKQSNEVKIKFGEEHHIELVDNLYNEHFMDGLDASTTIQPEATSTTTTVTTSTKATPEIVKVPAESGLSKDLKFASVVLCVFLLLCVGVVYYRLPELKRFFRGKAYRTLENEGSIEMGPAPLAGGAQRE